MPRLRSIVITVLLCIVIPNGLATAQAPTATPAPLIIASPVPQEEVVPGATPTWTPTPEGQVIIEAFDVANVRADPDPNAAQLGQMRSGEQYVATGRYFEWIQFQFGDNRRGWVFGQLVNVTGSLENLPEIGAAAVVEDTEEVAATEELAILTQTPGGLLTATAAARLNAPSGSLSTTADAPQGVSGRLPTFTFPPGVAGAPPTQGSSAIPTRVAAPATEESTGGLPPLVPILALGGVGLLGLAISALRR